MGGGRYFFSICLRGGGIKLLKNRAIFEQADNFLRDLRPTISGFDGSERGIDQDSSRR